jgi:hypothetical protein
MSNFRIRHGQPEMTPWGIQTAGPIQVIQSNYSTVSGAHGYPLTAVKSPDPRFSLAGATTDGVIYGQKHGTLYKIGRQ